MWRWMRVQYGIMDLGLQTRHMPLPSRDPRPARPLQERRGFPLRPRTSRWTCCVRPGAGLQILGDSMTWECGCHDAPAPAVRSAVGARSEHVDSRRTAARRRNRTTAAGTDQTSEALLVKTEKRRVVAPHDVDVSLGLSVSTTGYGDHNPVRDGSGDAVSGSGGGSVKRPIVRAQKAPSALHPETYST